MADEGQFAGAIQRRTNIVKETLFSEAQTFALPDKSEILYLVENIGNIALAPAIGAPSCPPEVPSSE